MISVSFRFHSGSVSIPVSFPFHSFSISVHSGSIPVLIQKIRFDSGSYSGSILGVIRSDSDSFPVGFRCCIPVPFLHFGLIPVPLWFHSDFFRFDFCSVFDFMRVRLQSHSGSACVALWLQFFRSGYCVLMFRICWSSLWTKAFELVKFDYNVN